MANKVGRPTTITEDVVLKLVAALQQGYSLNTALEMAHISKSMYYSRYEKDQAFQDRITDAKNFSTALAGSIVHDVLLDAYRSTKPLVYKNDKGEEVVATDKYGRTIYDTKYKEHNRIETAKWWLERKEREEFAASQKVIGGDDKSTTNNLFLVDDGKLKAIIAESGIQNLNPKQLLEAVEAEYVDGGGAEGSPAPIHQATVPSGSPQESNLS